MGIEINVSKDVESLVLRRGRDVSPLRECGQVMTSVRFDEKRIRNRVVFVLKKAHANRTVRLGNVSVLKMANVFFNIFKYGIRE